MATLRATTSSTWSRVDPDATDHIEAIAAEYDFWGAHEELTIDLKENSDGDTIISIHGYATFEASKPVRAEDGSVADREHGCTEEFLERLAPHLEEQLVIETVGHEKCRFPLLAGQWTVWPDGTVQYESFDHSPEQADATDDDDPSTTSDRDDSEAQYGVLNTERDVLLKLGSFGPTLTSSREKASKKAQTDDHLEPVRIETIPISGTEDAQ